MRVNIGSRMFSGPAGLAAAAALMAGSAGTLAHAQGAPVDLTRQAPMAPAPAPVPSGSVTLPVVPATPLVEAPLPPAIWSVADAEALLGVIRGIGTEGLLPKDYEPTALSEAIARGPGDDLNSIATRLFGWLAEDIRDGRTPMTARVQWFAVDPDQDVNPTERLLADALARHDVKGVLASLAPTHPDYAALKEMLAKAKDPRQIAMIRANMDRWRWLGRDLGLQYLMTNVPEQMLRLTVNNRIITTYRTIVGKPGRTATPQLAEVVEGVIFNPTWTVPQSIVKGEGLGARLIGSPAQARREGYVVTKDATTGMITVVQQPGKNNALGLMKLDMPNEHAIFLHDTPARNLFAQTNRALSHGCIRVERASELAMTMAILGADMPPEQGVELTLNGKYTKVPMTKTFPVYITYFTVARDVNGVLRSFADIYDRDAPVIDSFAKPRELHTTQRKSNEAIIKLDNPL